MHVQKLLSHNFHVWLIALQRIIRKTSKKLDQLYL